MSTKPTKDLDITLTVTHQIHVSKSFIHSLQEETANETAQFDEPSAWLDAYGYGKL